MKKLTNILLTSISILGGYLVAEGLLTGEQLSDIQSVTGLVLAGGGVSLGLIIAIIRAIPVQLVNAGYQKAVEKYGQEQVDNFVNKIDDVMALNQANNELLTNINNKLDEAQAQRENLLSE